MKSLSHVKCIRRDTDELVVWARQFAASPAGTPRDVRDRQIVADLVGRLAGAR